MENICFRCSMLEENVKDNEFLFFDKYFVEDHRYGENQNGVEQNNTDNTFLNNNCNNNLLLKYINKAEEKFKEHDTGSGIYKRIYTNLFLCKICKGMHNIDLILFYNKNSSFHNNVILDTSVITKEEEHKINNLLFRMENIFKTLMNNIDIIFFFLYLHESKKIKEITKFSLQTLEQIYEKINQNFIIKIELKSDFIKKKIQKCIIFTLIYIYLTFYKKIFHTLELTNRLLNFIINLYNQSVFVFKAFIQNNDVICTNEISDTSCKNKKKNDHQFGKKRKKNRTFFTLNKEKDEMYNNLINTEDISHHNKNQQVDKIVEQNIDNEDLLKKEKNNQQVDKNVAQNIDNEDLLKKEKNNNNNNYYTTENNTNDMEIYISYNNLCICGYYNKYNKEMSQTRWLINDSSVSCLSVEECIYNIFKNIFLFSDGTFISSGREDKDVRMMNIGRPFVFVLKETKFSLLNFYLFFKKIKTIEKINNTKIDSNVLQIQTIKDGINFLQNYNNIYATNVENTNKELSDNKKHLNGNNVTICNNIKNEKTTTGILSESINNCYMLIKKLTTCILYDVNTNQIVIEQPTYQIIEQKKIGNIQICNTCNEELEILLSDDVLISNSSGHNNTSHHDNITRSNNNGGHKNIRNDELDLSIKLSQQNKCSNLENINILNTYSFKKINTLVDVKLNNVAFSTNYELIKKIIKYGEDRKKKYKCLIYHSTPMSRAKIEKINQDVFNYEKKKNPNDSYVIKIMQKTPIRVVHRRGLINRERKIYYFNLVFIHKHFSLLYLLTQAGTYIKEFVNGDRGRTFPNLKYFFDENCFVNILNLDVSGFTYDND
ncbi:conserved protein, unknown function [Hepatocystis sp. ex Piliocolobus tephrosceles]|nr:conserved protein, unknown function [Hepatocystis sp. ex Piliocolobus tephrosceles]